MSTTRRTRVEFRLRQLAAFASRFRVSACGLALISILVLQPSAPARAACNVKDVLSAMKAGVETAQVCQPVCEDKYRCYGAAGLAIILTEISRKKGQDKVDSFCGTAFNSLNELLSDLKLLADLTQDQINDLSASLNDIAGDVTVLLSVLQCACRTEQLQLKNEASFGACANAVLEAVGCGEIDWTTATIGGCDPFGGAVGDIVDQGIDALISLGCGWLWDCGPSGSAGPPPYIHCGVGFQYHDGQCRPCSEVDQHAAPVGAMGFCKCEPPYTSVGTNREGAYWELFFCECSPPNVMVNGQCTCPSGASLQNGACQSCSDTQKYVPVGGTLPNGTTATTPACVPCPLGTKASADHLSCGSLCEYEYQVKDMATNKCVFCDWNEKRVYDVGTYGHCEACGYGQKASYDHMSCTAVCTPGQIYDENVFGMCTTCSENTYASYEKTDSSKGVCRPCADGTRSTAGATECQPLNCGLGSYQDPENPHACKSCPPTQIYIPTEKKLVPSAESGKTSAQIVPGHCGCGENQILQGEACVCAQGAKKVSLPGAPGSVFACACPSGAHFDAASGACACPAGATLNASKNTCACPIGQHLEGDKCVLPQAQALPAPKDCSTLGPNYVNNPKKPAACVRCPAGRIANADRNACVARARPAMPAIALPPAGRPPRRLLQCPPGMLPNAAGTACIRPRLQRVPPPALSRPPARRGAPAAAPGSSFQPRQDSRMGGQ